MMKTSATQLPHWELSVLSRAVAYQNLSGAAGNIGISQPQLSRIVARLEEAVGLELLDRSSRRKSGWTPVAFKLAELYAGSTGALEKQLRALAGSSEPKQLKVGTLEGLAGIAAEFCHALFEKAAIELIELDVHDLHELEELGFKGALDLMFVSRLPGRKKPRHSRLLGHQILEKTGHDEHTLVISPFEHQTHKDAAGREVSIARAGSRVLVSNSLAVRRRWIEEFGGSGLIPSQVRARGGAGRGSPVYLVGADTIGNGLWRKIAAIRPET